MVSETEEINKIPKILLSMRNISVCINFSYDAPLSRNNMGNTDRGSNEGFVILGKEIGKN